MLRCFRLLKAKFLELRVVVHYVTQLWRQRQEDHKLEASLSHIVEILSKKKEKPKESCGCGLVSDRAPA
jgi:hypothetical protein